MNTPSSIECKTDSDCHEPSKPNCENNSCVGTEQLISYLLKYKSKFYDCYDEYYEDTKVLNCIFFSPSTNSLLQK